MGIQRPGIPALVEEKVIRHSIIPLSIDVLGGAGEGHLPGKRKCLFFIPIIPVVAFMILIPNAAVASSLSSVEAKDIPVSSMDSGQTSPVKKPALKKSALKKDEKRAALERQVKAVYARLKACEAACQADFQEGVRRTGIPGPAPSRYDYSADDVDDVLERTKMDRRRERQEEADRQATLVAFLKKREKKCGAIGHDLYRLTKDYRDKYKKIPDWMASLPVDWSGMER